MNKWEYMTFCWSGNSTQCCFALNEFGSQGWELVQVVNNIAIMKKKVASDKKTTREEKQDKTNFETCWRHYRRKGSKKKSYEQWLKLTDEERKQVQQHIHAYVESVSDIKYQKDFERYLRDKVFNNVVYKDGKTLFDAENVEEEKEKSDDKMIINGVIYR